MTSELQERLLRRIDATGPLSFAEFVDAALYDPRDGFYVDAPVGADGHFVTSPHVSPVFGALLAREIEWAWRRAGEPGRFRVVDAGAGDGTLLRSIAAAASEALRDAAVWTGVERIAGARRVIESSGFEPVVDLAELATSSVGFLVANELLDSLPFHRLRADREGTLFEVRVGAADGRLVEVLTVARPALVEAAGPSVGPGEEVTASPAVDRAVGEIARVLGEGYAMIIDYDARDGWSPVRSYRHHRIELALLEDPGSRDLTSGVYFDRVARRAREAGLSVWGPFRQGDALKRLGFARVMGSVRAAQHKLERAGRWREALKVFGQRQAASVLVDPHMLGALQVLVCGTPGIQPPTVSGLDDQGVEPLVPGRPLRR